MLEMDIIQGRPALQVEFQISLAADLLDTITLVTNAPWLEGLDQWVYATHATLPTAMLDEIKVLFLLTQKGGSLSSRIYQLPSNHPAHSDFAAFTNWLNALSKDDFLGFINSTFKYLSHGDVKEQTIDPVQQTQEELRASLGNKLAEEQLDHAVDLALNPVELKKLFISMLVRFWEQFYKEECQVCLPLMERSIEYHRNQNYGPNFPTILTAVSGRRIPKMARDYEDIERVVFIPSCHIGPYVLKHHLEEPISTLIIHYNCRPTGAPERDLASSIHDLFPPLKALADETRLQILSMLDGRELYAQEIVERLDISQSAVSRHLKLMLAGDLLRVRKQDSMKYYSINAETLTALTDRLKSFRGMEAG